MKKNKEYILFISLFSLLIIFLFNKFIFGQYIFVSADTLAPQAIKQSINSSLDSSHLWYPYIFSGMPTIHSLLNINNYYIPHHVINFLHNLGLPWIWNFLFHYIFAAIGMYLLLRFLKQSKIASFLSSVLFSLSPYMIAYLVHGHGSQIMSAAYIPWIILYLFKIYKKISIKNYCILSLLIGFQLHRAHIQIVYYTWMMIGLFILIDLLLALKTRNIDFKHYFNNQLIIISSIIVGFLTSLSIYLPILNYSAVSTRGSDMGGFGIENATQWSFNINEITTFVLPHAYGFGGQTYWGYLPFTDFPNYIGIIVFLLAIVGFYKSDIKKEYKIFFMFTIIFSFLISLGHNLITFYKIFYYYFPFFNKFRVPIFILIIFQFSIYIYAAIGLTKLPDLVKNNFTRKIIFSTLFLILCIYTLFSFKQPQLFRPQLYNINDSKVFDNIKKEYLSLFQNIDIDNDGIYNENDKKILNQWTNHDYKILNSYIKLSQYQNTNINTNTLIAVLKQTNNEVNSRITNIKKDYILIISLLSLLLIFIYIYHRYQIPKKYFLFLVTTLIIFDYLRVDSEIIHPKYHIPNKTVIHKKQYLDEYLSEDEVIKYLASDNEKFRILDRSASYNRNRWAAFNIETINGYHPAKINLYDKLLKRIETQNSGVYYNGLIQLLNIKYIIHESKGILPNFEIVYNEFTPNKSTFSMSFFNNENVYKKDIYIYKNNKFLNRIFVAKDYEFVSNNDSILNKIINKNFDPVNLSFINKNDLNSNQINQLTLLKNNVNTKIDLISWESDEIKFKVNTESPQLIVLSEIFHPGWIINDDKIKIFRINGIFRGIIVPSGEKEITMEYKPSDIIIGGWISLVSYVFLLTIFLYNVYRRKSV